MNGNSKADLMDCNPKIFFDPDNLSALFPFKLSP